MVLICVQFFFFAFRLECVSGKEIRLRGVDLLDGTPILDIKPYIPDYDTPAPARLPDSNAGLAVVSDVSSVRTPTWVNNSEDNLTVLFGERAMKDLDQFPEESRSKLRQTISVILSADPRCVENTQLPMLSKLQMNNYFPFRSRYRRDRCSDRLYFFEVSDQAHITVWFEQDEGDSVVSNVLRIRRTEGSDQGKLSKTS